jgi:hypothetical protein
MQGLFIPRAASLVEILPVVGASLALLWVYEERM